MAFGPLFSLRMWGTICPCCENSENKSARASLMQLNRLGTRVSWHTAAESKQKKIAAAAGGFMSNLIWGSSGSSNDDNADNENPKPSILTGTPAQLKLVDATKESINNGESYPELQICPLKKSSSDNNKSKGGPLQRVSAAMSFQLDIPLHHVRRIESVDSTLIVIYTRDNAATEAAAIGNNGRDVVKEIEKIAARISFLKTDDRDAASLDMKVLMEWYKHRRQQGKSTDEFNDEENDLGGPVSAGAAIRQKAQKAAHFAKREIEMREKKRDREKRKSEHMKSMQNGGLKYTAMAMANRG